MEFKQVMRFEEQDYPYTSDEMSSDQEQELPFYRNLGFGYELYTRTFGQWDTNFTLIFSDETWFYPILMQFVDNTSLLAILSFFSTLLHEKESLSIPQQNTLRKFINLCMTEFKRKRAQKILQFGTN